MIWNGDENGEEIMYMASVKRNGLFSVFIGFYRPSVIIFIFERFRISKFKISKIIIILVIIFVYAYS